METAFTSDDHSTHNEPKELSENTVGELEYFDKIEYPKSDNNIDEEHVVELNSKLVHSLKHEHLSVQFELTDTKCDNSSYNSKDENMKLICCIDTCIKETNGNKEHHSLTKTIDPFNLTAEEELSQEKYQPYGRKFIQNDDKYEKSLRSENKVKSLSTIMLPCGKGSDENKAIHSSYINNDPFALPHDEDPAQDKCDSTKRKFCDASKDLGRDLKRFMGAMPEVNERIHQVDDAEVLPTVTEIKKLKTAYRVAYVHSQELLEKTNELIRIKGRAELVHSLINAFGLLRYIKGVSPRVATDVEVLGFHCLDYITFLQSVSASEDIDDSYNPLDKDAENYGLSYDCPVQKGIYETCCLISGATIVAAEKLIDNSADVAINWYGGWHHAKRDSASGFCYINDIVLGILKLREKFDRILYVDIDLHHGDGVEEAFCMTPKVMTVSFHKYVHGFFPGSGAVDDVGMGKGTFYSVNLPLLDGIKDAEFFAIFSRVMQLVRDKFQPQVIVMQCGADGLSSDPMASFNLTHMGIARCVGLMLSWNLPTLLLGGGGYNFANTARCWTFLTSLAAGKKLPLDIPEHENLPAYGSDFEMSTTAGNRKDCNLKQYLANLMTKVFRNLSNI